MHDCLNVDEIVRLLVSGLVACGWKETAVALACCCKKFEDPVLGVLWKEQKRLDVLLATLPEGVWDERHHDFVFKTMPTGAEWARFTKYCRRMRELELEQPKELIPSNVLSVLQLRTLNEPLLPNLKSLELNKSTADIVPFIPLFLSHMTTNIEIGFADGSSAVMVASMMINLPKLCPHVQSISLSPLPRDPAITNATSEILLNCNLDALRFFHVDSSLTEEARKVVFQLPNLSGLWTVFTEPIPPPEVSLPNLTSLDIEYHHDHAWLEGFHGTTFSKLTEVTFHAEPHEVGAFLEAFEHFALATSASAVLSHFRFHTSLAWSPSYYSLLGFKQLIELVVEFSCDDGCSSWLDDEILITLAQAMPQLEILQLGKAPCQVPSNVTVHGLIALAHHCLKLTKLCVHFQTDSIILALSNQTVPSAQETHLPREDCALTSLQVGAIPMPQHHTFSVFLVLLRIFPRLLNIEYVDEGWKWVDATIKLTGQIDTFVHRSISTLSSTLEVEAAEGTL
ncbi:hypothetical protein BJ322DRAFT_1108246 [Thelephora terrestris]|uniref:F-box domain-containing protein n=1 Tax=Thelephora terrestris TaxID=56493 RepID=A0A9P6HGR1_9AGAM|nr:hypothetical protein BJ322DRAFT_1108246 [Thelephora terrestris]